MVSEPFEIWEHRIDELLEKKLEPILEKLNELDENQRIIANIELISIANACRRKLRNHKPAIPQSVFEQLTAKLSITLKEVEESADPISILADFNDWCLDKEHEWNIKGIDIPD